jgi:hypothetical protein
MAFEEGKPWLDGTIEQCEAPHYLAVRTKSAYGEKSDYFTALDA